MRSAVSVSTRQRDGVASLIDLWQGGTCDGRVPPVTESVEPIGYDDEDNE